MREKRERGRGGGEASLDDDDEILETDSFIHDLWFPPPPPPPGILEARICTGIGLPVPEPPQLLHRIMPVPLHVPQPTSLSDHFVHRHGTLLEPLQVEHRNPPAIGGFSSSASIIDLMAHAPASTPNPCANCIATPGDMFASCLYIALCSKQTKRAGRPCLWSSGETTTSNRLQPLLLIDLLPISFAFLLEISQFFHNLHKKRNLARRIKPSFLACLLQQKMRVPH